MSEPNLCVISCHYNPAGYFTPRRNLMRFIRQLEAEGVPLFLAELAYDAENFFLPSHENILQLRTGRRNTLWHKENLLNLVEQTIVPETYDAIAWIDADMWFENLDWFSEASAALTRFPAIQLFDSVAPTKRDGSQAGTWPAYATNQRGGSHAGFAWAARRSLWAHGGLFETGILGGGDRLMSRAWFRGAPEDWLLMHYSDAPAEVARLERWIGPENQPGYIRGKVWHEWHGETKARSYSTRHEILRGVKSAELIFKRPDGLLEWAETAPPEIIEEVAAYFRGRGEDGADADSRNGE